MPSLFSLYRKIFFGRKPGWDGQPLPHIKVSCDNIHLSVANVAQYAKVCGFDFDGKRLPVTYLHVQAFRLQAYIFIHPGITFPLLGMIHLRNTISSYRTLNVDETYRLECQLQSSTETDSGLEFALISKAFVADELVWESTSTYLYRIEKTGRRARPPKAMPMDWDKPVRWQLSEDLGRRYAKASGDYNLIHLHPLLSKRFGFDRVLIHGMWSKARCIAEMMPAISHRPCCVDVAFKLPLFMPAEVTFAAEANGDDAIRFELRDGRGRRAHLSGELTFLESQPQQD
ncbi:MaoC family dehydratase [Shewanella sp. NFH-SH190041]|uniref:MaoC family dehydratase n=1 Tax=Shewanella sp. NFH-SH190041 TaxID=2950245 RepID=UPI0021C2E649|nr:MaoC/PaaZ C-terminal domain-containing protein [Shewanella sp. NFH-SH190041]